MSTARLNELVGGERGVTADTALRLAQLCKTTPKFLMHLQANVPSSASRRVSPRVPTATPPAPQVPPKIAAARRVADVL